MDHGGNRESRAAHPGRNAREPDRIRLLGHVERRALVEHGARVDDDLGEAERRKPRADRLAAPDRTQAHGEDIEPRDAADPRQAREIAIRQLRVEEAERPGPGRTTVIRCSTAATGSAPAASAVRHKPNRRLAGGDLRESVVAPGPRHRPSARHERDLLVRDRLEPPHTGGVRDPDAGRTAEIHGVGGVDRPPQRRRRGERREHENGGPPRGDGEESSRKARHHEEVETPRGGRRRATRTRRGLRSRRPKVPRRVVPRVSSGRGSCTGGRRSRDRAGRRRPPPAPARRTRRTRSRASVPGPRARRRSREAGASGACAALREAESRPQRSPAAATRSIPAPFASAASASAPSSSARIGCTLRARPIVAARSASSDAAAFPSPLASCDSNAMSRPGACATTTSRSASGASRRIVAAALAASRPSSTIRSTRR